MKDEAGELGDYLRDARMQARLSTHRLGELCGLPQSTVQRIESGFIKTPNVQKLQRIAAVLDLDEAEVFRRLPQQLPTDWLSPTTFFRTKYRDLPDDQMDDLTRSLARLLRRHGIDPSAAPIPGEDEQPEPAPRPTKPASSRTKRVPKEPNP